MSQSYRGTHKSAYYYDHSNGRSDRNNEGQPQRRRPKGETGNGFAEFPTQMSTPQINTPYHSKTQPQSRIRFADDTKPPQSSGLKEEVLVLGPRSTDRSAASPLQANTLDFSMIATPGGGKQGMRNFNDATPSDVQSASSGGLWPTGTPFTNLLRGVVSSTPNVNPQKLLSSTPYTAARESIQPNVQESDQTGDEYSALMFARSAPLSGYLRKLGKNIPTFKRRFFVLKPSTHLYYFLSPNDLEPRGCIDLDLGSENGGCDVREIGLLPDGTFRFELLFDHEEIADDTNISQRNSIVLEARTEEIGREWMRKLQTERLSAARDDADLLKTTLAEVKATSSRWEKLADEEEARANDAEKQRDMLQSEAKAWEEKFNDLNEAVGLLKKYINDGDSESSVESLARLNINDTNFMSVFKAINTIHDDYKLACETAEEERRKANELESKLEETKTRLSKAEAELSQVWQDNCEIRKELKKSKREKKILIREVRAQRAKTSDDLQKKQDNSAKPDSSCASTEQSNQGIQNEISTTEPVAVRPKVNMEQQRLVIELEEHVMSGLRLSEQFLTLNGIEPSLVGSEIDSIAHFSPQRNPNIHPLHASGVPTKLSSLLDDDSNDDTTILNSEEDLTTDEKESSGDYENYSKQYIGSKCNNNGASVQKSSVRHIAEAQVPDDPYLYYKEMLGEKHINQNLNDRFSEVCSPDVNHCQTNTISDKNSNDQALPSVGVESSVSGSTVSRVTETGQATSKLECPLTDVGATPQSYPRGSHLGSDGEIYHITFYSAKIGLQFQKVPVEKASLGLLTDAMTADLGANRTALDLQQIAAISQNDKKNNNPKEITECPPIRPVDMVLVCGFVGFDDSTGNNRPRIGARLVAFDGITVEVGQWTFESIRKSIQARGRPLTLSFRNDYLTPKQREILTKAVNDVKAHDDPTPLTKNIFRAGSQKPEKSSSIISKSSSVSSSSHKYYTFSEAGSTISSAVAPLMSNLMTGLASKKKQEDFTPNYLRRQTSSLDEMRHHEDFKSSLL